ncbi:MAG: acyl carrier protein [bacterium]|nr:acyl carrier protein [bacterium]
MTKEQIFQQVSEILVQSFELDPDEILLSAHLIDDLDLDSIDAIDLAVGLQDETGLDVAEEELREIRRVEDIVELVHRRLQDV